MSRVCGLGPQMSLGTYRSQVYFQRDSHEWRDQYSRKELNHHCLSQCLHRQQHFSTFSISQYTDGPWCFSYPFKPHQREATPLSQPVIGLFCPIAGWEEMSASLAGGAGGGTHILPASETARLLPPTQAREAPGFSGCH